MGTDPVSSIKKPIRERLSTQISDQIKELIISENIQIGEKLPTERELASRLGVSRVVIREAFRTLEQSGILSIKPGPQGGAFAVLDLYKPLFHSISDLFRQGKLTLQHFVEVRKEIECLSIRLAAKNANAQDILKLHEINMKIDEFQHDQELIRENNTIFHIAIAEISGNPLVKTMVQSLLELLKTLHPKSRYSSKFGRSTYERHESIISAIRERDVAECEKRMAYDTDFTTKVTKL